MADRVGAEGFGAAGLPFVGRRAEVPCLVDAVSRPPAVVLVEGEAGVGKSRLVREAAAVLAKRGVRVLTGGCHPLREPFPLGPVIDALRGAGGAGLPPAAEIDPVAGALVPLLPHLADRLPPPPPLPPSDPGVERHRLVRAVHEVLDALGPLMLVVEDVHWADDATRELLLTLARNPPTGLGLVLTYRAEDLPPGAPVLGSPYRRPVGVGGAEIRLTPLDEADVRTLASYALGARANASLAHSLYQRSAGLPLVLEEDLLILGEQTDGSNPLTELERSAVPRSLQEAVSGRVAELRPDALAVVQAAGVLAVPAAQELLAAVAELPDDRAEQGLTEALTAAVLREVEPGRYGFRHVLAQQAVYRNILGPRRRRLHLRAIEALRRQMPPALVQIAHHTRQLGDRQAWMREAEAAAEHAIDAGDQGVAAGLLRDLLDEPALPPDARSRAALSLSRVVRYRIDYTSVVTALRTILADPDLPTVTRGEIRLTYGLLLANQAHLGRASSEELEQAVEELADRPELASRAMAARALRYWDVPIAENLAWIERAETTVADSRNTAARLAVQANKITLLSLTGDPCAWPQLELMPRRGTDVAALRESSRAFYNAADSAIWTGHERAGELLDQAEELARLSGNPLIGSWSRVARVHLDWTTGRWEGLETRIAALTAEFTDMPIAVMEPLLFAGLLAIAHGQLAVAQEQLSRVVESAREQGSPMWEVTATAGLGRIRLTQGDHEAAWAAARPVLESLRRRTIWVWAVGFFPVAVQAALGCGERDEAERLVRDLALGLEGRDAPGAVAELEVCHGLLADRAEARLPHFERARLRYRGLGRPYDAAQAAELMAHTAASTDAHAGARLLAEAAEEYDRLGATYDTSRCRRALRDLGLARPSPRGRRGYGDELSPREAEVARLLACGAANREIAQALFLSPRTVEHHVAKVLRKLGVAGREEVRDVIGPQEG